VDAVHYFPFGEVWLEERPSSLPADYFFTAKEFDPETGFYNFGARYLDPRFSKWMTADPALGKYMPGAGVAVAYQSPSLANHWRTNVNLTGLGGLFTPSNLSVYGYGANNPGSLLDPDGEELVLFRARASAGDKPIMLLDSTIEPDAEAFIAQVQSELGVTIEISSAFRTPEKQVGANSTAKASLHQVGFAFDISPRVWDKLSKDQQDRIVEIAGNKGVLYNPGEKERGAFDWGHRYLRKTSKGLVPDDIHFERDPFNEGKPHPKRIAAIATVLEEYKRRQEAGEFSSVPGAVPTAGLPTPTTPGLRPGGYAYPDRPPPGFKWSDGGTKGAFWYLEAAPEPR